MKAVYNDDLHRKIRDNMYKNYHEKGGQQRKKLKYYKRKLNITDDDILGETLDDKVNYCLRLTYERKLNNLGVIKK